MGYADGGIQVRYRVNGGLCRQVYTGKIQSKWWAIQTVVYR